MNAFDIYHGNAHILKNKKILLIDDIITTGTTVNECSKILMKMAYAKQEFFPSLVDNITRIHTLIRSRFLINHISNFHFKVQIG